jgi:predicted short-subunit dehydrogenase-like oxidoreductase (DUF2520 family)
MQLVMIGAGNLAWHLAPAFENAGHAVSAVYSRHLAHARHLATHLYDARPTSSLNFADSPARLFVLAVPDDALEPVVRALVLPPNALVVHTSGTQPLDRLTHWLSIHSDVPTRAGVFYALQTFSRNQPLLDFANVPLCLETTDADSEAELVALGQELSNIVYLVDSAERQVLHLSAVLVSNFVNHLLAIAKDRTDANDLEFTLLHPLILETIRKALAAGHPAEVQTGPARRHDQTTIATHLALLSGQPGVQGVYKVLSDSIESRY